MELETVGGDLVDISTVTVLSLSGVVLCMTGAESAIEQILSAYSYV